MKEWAALIGVLSWDGHVAWLKLKQKGEAEYWRVQGQVLKRPNKIIIALSYVWSFNIWTCTPQSSGMSVGDRGNSCSVLFHSPAFWSCQCSEGEAPSVATLEKLQPEHHYEINSPEMLMGFGCPLLMRTCMNQIYGMTDKLYLTAHAQKLLWRYLHCRDQWNWEGGFQRFIFDKNSSFCFSAIQITKASWTEQRCTNRSHQAPADGSALFPLCWRSSERICAAGDRAVSASSAAPLQ